MEFGGKLAVALVADGARDLRDVLVALEQQLCRVLHAVLANVRGERAAVDDLKSAFIVEGFIKKRRDSSSIVVRLSKCCVR